MKLTYNETKELISALEEEHYMFEMRATGNIKYDGFEMVYAQHTLIGQMVRDLKLLIDKAQLAPVIRVGDDVLTYKALSYYVYDLKESRGFYESMSHVTSDHIMIHHHQIEAIIDRLQGDHDEFEKLLEDFEEQHLVEIDDELYMHTREWV